VGSVSVIDTGKELVIRDSALKGKQICRGRAVRGDIFNVATNAAVVYIKYTCFMGM